MNKLLANIVDDLRSLIRFRLPAMVTAWCICLFGWFVVLAWPDKYEASARIFVDTRTALTPVLEGLAIEQNVAAQINYVRQSLVGVPHLKKVASVIDPDFEKRPSGQQQQIIQNLRSGMTVTVEGFNGGGAVYTIRYQDGDRDRSLEAVNVLLNDFVQDTLGGKKQSSEAAQKFLMDQIQEYENRLRDAEQKLADFKKANVGTMPGAQGDYFSRLQARLDAKKKAEADLNIALTKKAELQRQLKGEAATTLVTETPRVADSAISLSDTASRIKDVETRRDQLLLKYTDIHPDVVAMNAMLEELKARRAAEVAALKRGDSGAAVASGAYSNPLFQSIQLALNETDVQIAALRGEIADNDQQISSLRRMVDTVPQVEAEYARLNRDYGVTRAQYTALVERLEKAKLSDEASQQGAVRFEVVDPPNAGIKPISPKRVLLVPLVLVVGVGAGFAVAYLLHFLKPVFSSARRLTEITGLPVLGVVSVTGGAEGRSGELMRASVTYIAFLMFLFITCVAVTLMNEPASHVVRKIVG